MFAFSMANFWSSMGMARGNAARTFLQTVEFLKSLESNHRGSSDLASLSTRYFISNAG